MKVFAVDPGNTHSAYVIYDAESHSILQHAYIENETLLLQVKHMNLTDVSSAIEMIASYGMPVGKDVFETCLFIGRMMQVIKDNFAVSAQLVYRRDVKHHLCNSAKAKDSNVRQAVIDKFPGTGGGKVPQVGTKAKPGPLFGVSGDIWAAVAVALTHANK